MTWQEKDAASLFLGKPQFFEARSMCCWMWFKKKKSHWIPPTAVDQQTKLQGISNRDCLTPT